jgi:ADP-heptose:LPS heptosyltransferase
LTGKSRYRTPPKRVLIVKQRGIGDIILSIPAFRSIRAHFKDSLITLVVEHPSGALFAGDPDMDEIVEMKKSISGILKTMERIRGRYDIAFDLISTPFSLFMSLFSGARIRVGWEKPGRKRALLYTHRVDISHSIPAIDANLRALLPLHIEPITRDVSIHLSEVERRKGREYWWSKLSLDISKLTLIIHPGNLFETKQWFPARFASLADKLQREGYQVVITGSREESAVVAMVMESAALRTRRLPAVPLREFARFLSNVDVAIVNDGGVLHLAQAVGTKTCAIFGSTDPSVWFPYTLVETGNYVYSDLVCSPCGRKRCNSLKCLKDITVNEVFEKAIGVINSIEREECFT